MPDKEEVIKVKPFDYQPSKAELEADMSIPTTPENLLKAVVREAPVENEAIVVKVK